MLALSLLKRITQMTNRQFLMGKSLFCVPVFLHFRPSSDLVKSTYNLDIFGRECVWDVRCMYRPRRL